MPKPSPAEKAEAELRRIALSYPATSEHFPWGHRTIKVRDKAFVFMGQSEDGFFFTAKLPTSRHVALMLPFAEPTGYGLGKSGWVSANFASDAEPPVDMLAGWLDESYRAVAPAKLVKELDASGGAANAQPTAKKATAAKAPAKKAAPTRKAATATKATAKKTAPAGKTTKTSAAARARRAART